MLHNRQSPADRPGLRTVPPKSLQRVFRTPWPGDPTGDPRVDIQDDHGKAKPYQVRQVLAAIEKKRPADA